MNVWRLVTHHSRDDKGEHHDWQEKALGWSLEQGRVAIGWSVGDLRRFKSADDISQETRRAHPGLYNAPYSGKQLWAFCNEMNIGDLVILSTGTRRAVMRVTGDYEFVVAGDGLGHYQHQRTAEITKLNANDLWDEAGPWAPGWGVYWALIRCLHPVSSDGKRAGS